MTSHLYRTYCTHPQVRPFLLARGRTRAPSRWPILIHTMVTAPCFDPVLAAALTQPERLVYEYAQRRVSVAEISARTGLSLGLVRVIVGDLANRAAVEIHADTDPVVGPEDDSVVVLERVLRGLQRL